jgi:anti-sigma factor RsiW
MGKGSMTGHFEHLPPEDEADLAALADGCLTGPRRTELAARVAADPTLAEAFERQRTALAMIAAAAEPAPLDLRLRIEELRAAPPPQRFWGRRRRPAIAAAFALAATLIAFAVLLAGRGPVVDDVLAVALRPATAPAATGEAFEGIRFPRYGEWRMTGARTDLVDGRRVRTVFYERDGRKIAYAIVAGPALDDVGELRALHGDGDLVAVTWTRHGRTCMIIGSGVDADVLAHLAVW